MFVILHNLAKVAAYHAAQTVLKTLGLRFAPSAGANLGVRSAQKFGSVLPP
jgi:hypothetical protein